VRAEAVEQELQVLEVGRGPFVCEPLLERAVEALELAERLRVGGGGVDQLDADLGELALELDRDPEQAAGEARVVVGKELAREPGGGAGREEAGPGRLPARARAGDGGKQEAGVIVQAVDDPGRLALGELELGAVDLPQVVRRLALEAPCRLRPPGGPGNDQVVTP
jgi:hypothetical protein